MDSTNEGDYTGRLRWRLAEVGFWPMKKKVCILQVEVMRSVFDSRVDYDQPLLKPTWRDALPSELLNPNFPKLAYVR